MAHEIGVAVGLLGADFLAHEEHRRAGGQNREGKRHPRAGLGVVAGRSDQRSGVDRDDDGALRSRVVAGLVVGFMINDLVGPAVVERAGKLFESRAARRLQRLPS